MANLPYIDKISINGSLHDIHDARLENVNFLNFAGVSDETD
jgi:hypothetical protein